MSALPHLASRSVPFVTVLQSDRGGPLRRLREARRPDGLGAWAPHLPELVATEDPELVTLIGVSAGRRAPPRGLSVRIASILLLTPASAAPRAIVHVAETVLPAHLGATASMHVALCARLPDLVTFVEVTALCSAPRPSGRLREVREGTP
jgi:hypothetical protein